jgi:acyl-coenzyme A synthetase/AMP-(fatty) acid ligase
LRESAVVAIQSEGFEGWLICCAYVPGDRDVPAETLRKNLAVQLPAYMLPARWMRYDALPKNANGKIDRPRLKNAFLVAESGQAQREAPLPRDTGEADRMIGAVSGRS